MDVATRWPCVATLIWNSEGPGFACAGGTLHGYDAVKKAQESGTDGMLESVLVWDDEVWAAVEIGAVEAGEGLLQIMERVEAVQPPRFWLV